VLVVEDEAPLRWSVTQTLTMGPHTVLEAENAQSARALLRSARQLLRAHMSRFESGRASEAWRAGAVFGAALLRRISRSGPSFS
jgi:DNA-binding NtrC family response regulator